jgi:hypothetical protein
MQRIIHPMWLLVPLCFFSCKKYIQQKEQQAALAIITNGNWYVKGYQQNDSDITASFSGYLFKFNADNTVTGTRNNVSQNGVWSANISAVTVTANFPAAGLPLVNLNEVWKITDSDTNYVVANSIDTISHASNILHLQKQ